MRAPTRRSLRRIIAATLALGALATAMAPRAGAGSRDRIDEARRRADFPAAVAYNFDYAGVPDELGTGRYRFSFVNASDQPHEILFFKMAKDREGDSRREIVEALDNFDLSLIDVPIGPEGPEPNGAAFAKPFRREQARVTLGEAGRYLYVCFIPDAKTGKPHYQLGMFGTVDVK